MKKTALFNLYTPFGTSHRMLDILYRGRVLRTVTLQDLLDWSLSTDRHYVEFAQVWAKSNGFTHYNLSVQPKV